MGQPRELAHAHVHRKILTFDVARADVLCFRIAVTVVTFIPQKFSGLSLRSGPLLVTSILHKVVGSAAIARANGISNGFWLSLLPVRGLLWF